MEAKAAVEGMKASDITPELRFWLQVLCVALIVLNVVDRRLSILILASRLKDVKTWGDFIIFLTQRRRPTLAKG